MKRNIVSFNNYLPIDYYQIWASPSDTKRSGCSIEAATPETFEQIHDVVLTDLRSHLFSDFNFEWLLGYKRAIRKLGAAFVLKWSQTQSCGNVEEAILADEFMHRFISTDETWIHHIIPDQAAVEIVGFSWRVVAEENKGGSVSQQSQDTVFGMQAV